MQQIDNIHRNHISLKLRFLKHASIHKLISFSGPEGSGEGGDIGDVIIPPDSGRPDIDGGQGGRGDGGSGRGSGRGSGNSNGGVGGANGGSGRGSTGNNGGGSANDR